MKKNIKGYIYKRREKECLVCKEKFMSLDKQFYCTTYCRKRKYQVKNTVLPLLIDNSVLGAKSELLVAVDLLNKGYEVFRSLTLKSRIDLVIMNENKQCKTIQVKTNSNNHSLDKYKQEYADILAIVIKDKIIYIPDFPVLIGIS